MRLVLLLLLAVLSGCASYSQGFGKIEVLLSQQKPQEALIEHEKQNVSSKNKLLFLLDEAMLQRMSGNFAESNASFEQAKVWVDKLAALSVVEQAGALTINDSVMSYEGEDYEQIAIHIYSALNYIELGLWDDARVEALQVDERLKKIKEKDASVSIQDAFALYLTGLIYEHGKEWGDAMISYRQAFGIYQKNKTPTPLFLQQDLLRLSQYLGLQDEYKSLQKQFGMKSTLSLNALNKKGEVVVLLHQSLAPIKRAENIIVYSDDGFPHRISFPVYQSRPDYLAKARLVVGKKSIETVLIEDFDALARASLESHRAAMTVRLIARAILKEQMSKKAKKNGGALAGFLADAAAFATETADTRSWLTLPKNIHFARLPIIAGDYPARLELLGQQGQIVATFNLGEVHIERGKKTVLEKTFVSPYRQ